MIVKHDWTEYKPWLNIMELELVVGVNKVVIDMRNIGMFEMNDFSESYIKGKRIRRVGHVILEIHESQVGDIEYLYRQKDINGINNINVIFEDGHMEEFITPNNQQYRITSTGDLRIEMGHGFKIYGTLTEKNLQYEHSRGFMFYRNYIEDEDGCLVLVDPETYREEGVNMDKIDHPEIIENKTNELLDILGEIISCLGGKRVNRKRLVAIASLVDYIYDENLFIQDNTILYSDDIENHRIEQFRTEDYIGREVHNPKLKKIINSLCDEHRKTKISKLIELVNDYMDMYYFTEEEHLIEDYEDDFDEDLEEEEIDSLLDEIDELIKEKTN